MAQMRQQTKQAGKNECAGKNARVSREVNVKAELGLSAWFAAGRDVNSILDTSRWSRRGVVITTQERTINSKDGDADA